MQDFDAVYRKYYDDVFRFLRGLSANESLAEELTQETFFRAFRSIGQYRGESELRVWLCSIARNLFYTHCRKAGRSAGEAALADMEADSTGIAELIEDRDMALQIHRILHDMREPYKEVFSLRIFGELSFAEIGGLFGKTAHWTCVTYHRAKAMIQKEIGGDSNENGM